MISRWRLLRLAALVAWALALDAHPPSVALAAAGKPPATAKKSAAAPRRNRATASLTTAACLGKALGGMENIARVSTLYTRHQVERGGIKGTQLTWRDVRGAVRESLDVPGAFTEVTVFDGVRGWRRGTNGVVVSLSGVDLGDVVAEAYLGSHMHIVPGRIPGRVERVGLDRKTGLVKLRATPQGGTPMMLFLDTLTCLPVRVDAAGERARPTFLGDWRTVSGIKLPFAIRRGDRDSVNDMKLTLLEARFDAPLPRGVFAKPASVGPP